MENGGFNKSSEAEDRRVEGDVIQRKVPQCMGRKIERIVRLPWVGSPGFRDSQRSKIGHRFWKVRKGLSEFADGTGNRERYGVLDVGFRCGVAGDRGI